MKQITIVSENVPEVVAEITDALAAANVNIETWDSETTGESLVTTITVDRYDDALRALAHTSVKAITEDAIVIQLEDKPGQLARIMHRFQQANLQLRSVHILRRDAGTAFVAVATDRTAEAMRLLEDLIAS